ncbi:MAG: type II toxin-antitoxin system RelE/ParE family toxin [Gammaproteobacteria bacterium]|nr:type II toxin-antitoxin system RelE/ParE family toxin [Gammaproteobacteria bacterium]
MLFIETKRFTRLLGDFLSDESYRQLQSSLMQNPDAGALVPGSGGVRKLRWAASGTGKRGGVRVIYVWKHSKQEIWMLAIYGKADQATIPAHTLKRIAEAIDDETS